jgi:lipoyl(octanoyl) transferase
VTHSIPCRVLPYEVRGGVENMALDHALLDSVDSNPVQAVLRTYGWSTPTLSLGYFQHIADARSQSRWAGVPIVRRPSGGGALWHDRELTYALVVPRSHRLAGRPSDLYRAVHAAIVELLCGVDVPAKRRGEDRAAESTRPFLCFLDRDPEDVLLAASKIVGSAQRRRPNAILQHGSLLLARSAATPELPGLDDLATGGSDPEVWHRRLEIALPRALELTPCPGTLANGEATRADRLARELYANRDWTERR